jgi:1-acyl-sn-glycerol-3-phosphate acyltransferase
MNLLNRLGRPYLPLRPIDRIHALALAALVPLVFGFLLAHMLWGILVAGLLFPVLPAPACDWLVRFWSRILLVACGVELDPEAVGRRPHGQPGALLLMNHVSWVDVFVVAAVIPARFVAKSEIRAWPLAGWLARSVGTLFIERGRRHAVAQVNREIAARLQAGQSIGIFPEGTTTDGSQLLRFHSNLVQAALQAGAPIVPVALQYSQDGAPSYAAAYVGDMNLGESMLRILIAPRLRVSLRFLPPIDAAGVSRQEIARQARRAIGRSLALPEADLPEAADDGTIAIDALGPSTSGG